MMIVPIWFSVGNEKKHHVHGNGYVDGSRKRGPKDSSGGGGSGIVVSNRKQIQIAELIVKVMRERMQLNHQTFFKQDIPLFSKRIPFCTATFRTYTHPYITYVCTIHTYTLTRNISLATNVLVIIIVFLFAINSLFGISTNVCVTHSNGFRKFFLSFSERKRACVRAYTSQKFYSYAVRFHLYPFDDD